MQHRVPHSLTKEEAKAVVEKAWAHYSERFSAWGPSINWLSEEQALVGLTLKGKRLEAKFRIDQESYFVEAEIPFLLRPFQGLAIKRIDQEVQKWIKKA